MNEVNGSAKNKKQNNITSRVRSSFLSAIEKYGMDTLMSSHGAVVAGFSGGADSICMLYLLNEYCTEHEIKLIAAHVNHMIRGEDADSDESRETRDRDSGKKSRRSRSRKGDGQRYGGDCAACEIWIL